MKQKDKAMRTIFQIEREKMARPPFSKLNTTFSDLPDMLPILPKPRIATGLKVHLEEIIMVSQQVNSRRLISFCLPRSILGVRGNIGCQQNNAARRNPRKLQHLMEVHKAITRPQCFDRFE